MDHPQTVSLLPFLDRSLTHAKLLLELLQDFLAVFHLPLGLRGVVAYHIPAVGKPHLLYFEVVPNLLAAARARENFAHHFGSFAAEHCHDEAASAPAEGGRVFFAHYPRVAHKVLYGTPYPYALPYTSLRAIWTRTPSVIRHIPTIVVTTTARAGIAAAAIRFKKMPRRAQSTTRA